MHLLILNQKETLHLPLTILVSVPSPDHLDTYLKNFFKTPHIQNTTSSAQNILIIATCFHTSKSD